METTIERPVFSFAHVGVNMPTPEASNELAERFSAAFGLPVTAGNSSHFAGNGIEIMNRPYLGAHGHIAIGTPDMDAAMAYLSTRGYTFDQKTAKYKDGTLTAIYLCQDFGGFAVHLVLKR